MQQNLLMALQLFHITIFIAAFTLFFRKIRQRLAPLQNARPLPNPAPRAAQIRSVLRNVILQHKLYQKPLRGLMHSLIFYGFLLYSLHTLSQMIAANLMTQLSDNQVNPYTFLILDYLPTIFGDSSTALIITMALLFSFISLTYYFQRLSNDTTITPALRTKKEDSITTLLLANLAALALLILFSGSHLYHNLLEGASLLILVALAYFAGRRFITRPPELDVKSISSVIIIALIALLVLSTLVGSAARFWLTGENGAGFVGKIFASLLFSSGSSNATISTIHNIAWWAHLITVYTFMIYLPYSKHSHLIFAPLNFFQIEERPAGAIDLMDLEDEDGCWGSAKLSEFKRGALLDGLSCIECGRCTERCPAWRTGKALNPKEIIVKIKNAIYAGSDAVLASAESSGEPSSDSQLVTADEVWGCTSCYSCVDACPVGNNPMEPIIDMRRQFVQVESRFPQQLQSAFSNMENQSNPWGIGSHSRMDWCSDLEVKTMADNPDAELLYWVGCAGAFDERNKQIARSIVKLLKRAEVNFAILGLEENCTGDSARRGGNEYLYQMLATQNIETMNRYGVKNIITACPHCFNALANEYPQLGGNYQVKHHSEYILELISSGKLKLKKESTQLKTIFHDSCYLGRYNQIYQAPRSLIKEATGTEPLEASDHHRESLCCGAGGAQMWMEEQNERINLKRTDQLVASGAQVIGTSCPFCITMLSDGIKSQGQSESVRAMDIAEIVAEALD